MAENDNFSKLPKDNKNSNTQTPEEIEYFKQVILDELSQDNEKKIIIADCGSCSSSTGSSASSSK